jgi:hypothetical protein
VKVEQIATIMKPPAVEYLAVCGLQERKQPLSWTWDAALFPDGASNIRTLDLYRNYLHKDALAISVKCCKTLHHLSYAQFSNNNNNRHSPFQSHSLDFSIVIQAPQKHHGCLRSLALYNTGATDISTSTNWITASLASFDTLKQVCVDASVLFEQTSWANCSAKVPSSLVHLRLQNTWRSLMQDIEDQEDILLVFKYRTLHPSLESVVIQWMKTSGQNMIRVTKTLQQSLR